MKKNLLPGTDRQERRLVNLNDRSPALKQCGGSLSRCRLKQCRIIVVTVTPGQPQRQVSCSQNNVEAGSRVVA